MTKLNLKLIKEIISDASKNYDIDINYYIKNKLEDLFDKNGEMLEGYNNEQIIKEIREILEDYDFIDSVCREEVNYYLSAMDYLRENDPSLRESLELAEEYGFFNKDAKLRLNSEILASLLKTNNNKINYEEIKIKIFEELNSYLERFDRYEKEMKETDRKYSEMLKNGDLIDDDLPF